MLVVGQKWSGQIRICRFGHGLRRPSEEAPEKGCWTSIISQFTYTMRNFIWFLRRSAPCCKRNIHTSSSNSRSALLNMFVALWRLSEACSVKQLKWIVGSLHPATFFLWAPALKRPKWTENCAADHQRSRLPSLSPIWRLQAEITQEALTAAAPFYDFLHFSPDNVPPFGSLPPFNVRPTFTFFFLSWFWLFTITESKSLHTLQILSRAKSELNEFCSKLWAIKSCEQLKGLCQGFTVTNWKTFSGRNVQQILDRTIGSRPSINQTLRRPLISVQNCNYFRALCRNEQTCWAFLQSQAATPESGPRQHLLRSFNRALMPDFD